MSTAVRFFKYLARWSGNKVWIDKATSHNDLRAFLKTLKPKKTVAPLIRIGGANDGGYLIPDDFVGVGACISPGVAQEVSFDFQLAERGLDIHMFDASVKGPPIQHPKFHFTEKFFDVVDDTTNVRLDSVANAISQKSGDMLLQMDIEGAEWRVLLDVSRETLLRFRVIVIEFHAMNQLFGRSFFRLTTPVFKKLLATHEIVHLHPNNCLPLDTRNGISIPPVLEITFLRKDRQFNMHENVALPNQLDAKCVVQNADVKLPNNWW